MRTQVGVAFDFTDDGTRRNYVLYRDENGTLHRVDNVQDGYDLETLPERPLNKADFMPLYEKHWVKWEGKVDGNDAVWTKKAKYLISSADPAGPMKREIELGEALRARPHPNILKYHGCTHDEGSVVNALVFERLHVTLEVVIADFWKNVVGVEYYMLLGRLAPVGPAMQSAEVHAANPQDDAAGIPRISKDGIPFDVDTVMGDIDPAFAHLRSLGYSYVDISGHNIMGRWDEVADWSDGQQSNIDKNDHNGTTDHSSNGGEASSRAPRTGRWCLIDLGSCFPSDHVFDTAFGTPGFQGTPGIAKEAHVRARAHLLRWIETGWIRATDQFSDTFKRVLLPLHKS